MRCTVCDSKAHRTCERCRQGFCHRHARLVDGVTMCPHCTPPRVTENACVTCGAPMRLRCSRCHFAVCRKHSFTVAGEHVCRFCARES